MYNLALSRLIRLKSILGWFFILIPGTGLSAAEVVPPVDCIINPYKTVNLSSAVPGVIEKLHVDRSDLVQKGQVIAELNTQVEKASVKLAEARAAIKSEVMVGQLNLKYDRLRKKRLDSLFGKNLVSSENKDEADRDAQLAALRLKQAKELSTIRKLELVKTREELQQKIVRSPIEGFVIDTFKSPGEYVEEQTIVRIAQLDPLTIEAIVPMSLFGKVKVGMWAEVFPEILAGDSRNAQVIVVDPMGDAASGTFGVRLTLPNTAYQIPAGMKCDLKFLADSPTSTEEGEPKKYLETEAYSGSTVSQNTDGVVEASP